MFNISATELWLLIGCFCLAIEFTKFPGIGFLFLGIGALLNTILIYNYTDYVEYQYTSFGLLSFLSFLILWWPLKKYIYENNVKPSHFDLIGSEVEVSSSPIFPGENGQVKWSGVMMNARLSPVENAKAEVSEKLQVTEVQGNVLICRKIVYMKQQPTDK